MGLIAGGHVPMPAERSCGNRSGRVFYKYNLPHVIGLTTLAALAELVGRVPTATEASKRS